MDGQEVTRLETTYLPETNENRIRMYGADGELICEQIMAVDFGQEIAIPRVEFGRNLDIDMREWDREQDAHHSVYRQEYPQLTLWQHLNTIQSCNAQRLKDLLLGEWETTEEEPDIKAERGGALDEFLDEFKPQTTPERSDEQK